jgi:hypothetical protein
MTASGIVVPPSAHRQKLPVALLIFEYDLGSCVFFLKKESFHAERVAKRFTNRNAKLIRNQRKVIARIFRETDGEGLWYLCHRVTYAELTPHLRCRSDPISPVLDPAHPFPSPFYIGQILQSQWQGCE